MHDGAAPEPGEPMAAEPSGRALAAACSAFLLFTVQPMAGRILLPSFGGSPATWATCLVFFQAALLAGYACAHALATRMGPRRALGVHAGLLALAALLLPWRLAPPAGMAAGAIPELAVALALAGLVGMPVMVLSMTTPRLEAAWPREGVRRLYAWSNVGSLAGLMAQPLLFEPLMGLSGQALAWSLAFVAWSVFLLALLRRAPLRAEGVAPMTRAPLSRGSVLAWMALAAAPSALLVAATQRLTQDVAPVPLLWAVPLATYLITCIVAFARERLAARWPWMAATLLAGAGAAWQGLAGTVGDLAVQGLGILAVLGAAGMLCHGELARRAPPASRVTTYYLAMAGGGVLGSAAATFLPPLLLDDAHEWGLVLAAPACVVLAVAALDRSRVPAMRAALLATAGLLALGSVLAVPPVSGWEDVVDRRRSFFGILRVLRSGEGAEGMLVLRHGSTDHGQQFLDEAKAGWATAYYGADSGAQAALAFRREAALGRPLRVTIIGLGAGTLAAAAQPGDAVRFLEIDPNVTDLARKHFTFLDACGGCEVATGDGRILMREDLAASGPGTQDVILVDAFSGDSVPAHLLTREFFDLVAAHLAEGGVAGFHVTNRYLDLERPALALAVAGWDAILVESAGLLPGTHPADWVLLSRAPGLAEAVVARGARASRPEPRMAAWTDDEMSILPLLRLR